MIVFQSVQIFYHRLFLGGLCRVSCVRKFARLREMVLHNTSKPRKLLQSVCLFKSGPFVGRLDGASFALFLVLRWRFLFFFLVCRNCLGSLWLTWENVKCISMERESSSTAESALRFIVSFVVCCKVFFLIINAWKGPCCGPAELRNPNSYFLDLAELIDRPYWRFLVKSLAFFLIFVVVNCFFASEMKKGLVGLRTALSPTATRSNVQKVKRRKRFFFFNSQNKELFFLAGRKWFRPWSARGVSPCERFASEERSWPNLLEGFPKTNGKEMRLLPKMGKIRFLKMTMWMICSLRKRVLATALLLSRRCKNKNIKTIFFF